MLDITVDWSFSQEKLEGLCKKRWVFQSAHIGNFAPDNLASLLTKGLMQNILDKNITYVDNLFYPEQIGTVSNKKAVHDSILCTHLDKSVKDAHIGKLKNLFPEAVIFTASELVAQNIKIYERIMSLLAKYIYSDVKRYVKADGVVIDRRPVSKDNFLHNCFQLFGNNNEGYIIPNEIDILIEAVIQYKKSEIKDGLVYIVSGPVMYLYIEKIKEKMNTSYSLIKDELILPEKMTLVVLPMSNKRLIVRKKDKDVLDSLVGLYYGYNDILKEKKEALKIAEKDKKREVSQFYVQKLKKMDEQIILWCLDYYKKIWYNKIEGPTFFCQRDIKSVKDLYNHKLNFTLSSFELEEINLFFKKYYLNILKKLGINENDIKRLKKD